MSGTHGGTKPGHGSRLVPSPSGDPKTRVRRRGGLDRLHGCRLDALVVRVPERPGAAADEYGYEAHRALVDESRPDRSLSDLGAADVHVLVAGVSSGSAWVTTRTGRRAAHPFSKDVLAR